MVAGMLLMTGCCHNISFTSESKKNDGGWQADVFAENCAARLLDFGLPPTRPPARMSARPSARPSDRPSTRPSARPPERSRHRAFTPKSVQAIERSRHRAFTQ